MLEPILPLGAAGEDVHSRRLLSGEVVQQCSAGRLYFTLSERYLWGRWHREHSPLTSDAVSEGTNPRTLIRLVVSSKALQPANGVFRTYRSVRRRPGEPLDWELTRTPTRRPNAIQQLVRGISAALDVPQTDPPVAGP